MVYLLCTVAIFIVVKMEGAADFPECLMGSEPHRLVKTAKTLDNGR